MQKRPAIGWRSSLFSRTGSLRFRDRADPLKTDPMPGPPQAALLLLEELGVNETRRHLAGQSPIRPGIAWPIASTARLSQFVPEILPQFARSSCGRDRLPQRPAGPALPILILAGALVLTLLANQAAAEGVPIEAREPEALANSLVLRKSSFVIDACRLIDRLSRVNDIPGDYIARLISVESGFSPTAVSPKGAQGIAQFMPETARLRGLADPFEPGSALKAAIEYLSELRHRFGNLGLAAAAYNAGEKRVEALIAGKTRLPLETRNYVFAITGRQIGDWIGVNHPTAPYSTEQKTTDFIKSCSRRVRGQLRLAALPVTGMVQQPWGVQIFESFSRTQAVGMFLALQERLPGLFGTSPPMVMALRNYSMGTALRQRVYLGAPSRAEADSKCAALQQKGIACLVRRTGR